MNKSGFNLPSIVGLTLGILFFWIFAFNIWFSNNILDRENFVNTTTQVLTTEASRNAIANEVVEQSKFELQHKSIIDRFGRYPHRNKILKRRNSKEETKFLKEPNSSF